VTASPAALVDMRDGIDTLTRRVAEQRHPATEGNNAFIFTIKERTRLKILMSDRNGVWLCTPRLHQGHFTWPRDGDEACQVTPEQFAWLIAGVDEQRLTGGPAEK